MISAVCVDSFFSLLFATWTTAVSVSVFLSLPPPIFPYHVSLRYRLHAFCMRSSKRMQQSSERMRVSLKEKSRRCNDHDHHHPHVTDKHSVQWLFVCERENEFIKINR